MKNRIRIIIETLVVGLLVFVLTATNMFSALDYMAKDALYQRPRGIDGNIKIIGIDEETLATLGPIQTWSRRVYADVLFRLNEDEESKPAVVGFDIQFSGELDESDKDFVKSAKDSGNVVIVDHLMYGITFEEGVGPVTKVQNVEEPYDKLFEVCDVGFSNVAQDSDGVVRRIKPTEMYNSEEQKMFSRVLYEKYCEIKGLTPKNIPVDRYGQSIINYSGEPGDYEYISMMDLLDGKIDSRTFKDSIVLVGAYAPGMQDSFSTPNGGSEQMYGIEIHANILQSYLQGRFSINGNPVLLGLVSAAIAMLLFLAFKKMRPWISILAVVAVSAGFIYVLVKIHESGYSYSLIYLPLVLLVGFVYNLAVEYIVEKRRKNKVLNAFRKYVAPQIVEEISKKGDFQIKVGGENRDIAVLFVDIRGFTTMSELLEPEQVVEILNEYLTLTTQSIFNNSGTLDKFVGDATMAVFNSPFDLEDYEFKAVCAAMDIVNGGKALEKTLLEKYGRTVGFGVGVNVGPAVVGNIGCEFRMDFTAIGDTVNTAARLEANAKKGQVLISDVLYERLKDRIEVNEIGEIPLKGKSKGVFVYEVTEVHR